MHSTKPEEPDWNEVIDEILASDDELDDKPTGIHEYFLSQHSKDLRILESFDWPDEWIKERPVLLKWLEHEFEEWWEDQAYEDEAWRGWLEGWEIRTKGDSFITDLWKKLRKIYCERITETYNCEDCGKELSEKYSYGHPNHVVRLGTRVKPDQIEYNRIFCNECWKKDRGIK